MLRFNTKKPSRIYIDVTNACQLHCLHCCTESGSPQRDELTLAEIKDLLNQMHEMQVNTLVLSGGEPMIRPDLPDMLEYARKKGLNTTLLTNGLLIDENAARLLVELKVRVKISLDGVTPETHDFLRGRGTFDKTLEVLSLLRSAGAEGLVVHYTVHRKNCTELLKLPGLLATLGVRNVVVGIIKPSGRAKVNDSLLIPPSMVPYIRQKIDALADDDSITLQRFSDRGWEGFGCPATCNKFGITATGRVTTCAFFGQELLGGSIREYPLVTLWERHITENDMFVANEQCAHCPNLPDTGGGCRARALYYHLDLNGVDPYCCALYQKKVFLEKHRLLLQNALQNRENAFV